jgi:hypothetical protein
MTKTAGGNRSIQPPPPLETARGAIATLRESLISGEAILSWSETDQLNGILGAIGQTLAVSRLRRRRLANLFISLSRITRSPT